LFVSSWRCDEELQIQCQPFAARDKSAWRILRSRLAEQDGVSVFAVVGLQVAWRQRRFRIGEPY
jgi:hypothetical protein